ncbi:ATP-binding protein [Streptomyces sp. SID12501]|uniref:ATP-binding protein n=1 Tax=Streptomyces sp. SID12501 TaxID=2706042 RepID=A0A6B3BTJ4_9ACTN|nr:ATP-binding protein [Streptomyces sp. SID12501]
MADDAESIVCELAANAVVHAKGIGEFFEVGMRRRDGVLIVEGLSDKWGVRPRETGKTVWAHLVINRGGAAC